MGRMPFLPQEFGRAQEDSGPHFPAHHIAPLIDLEGQIAVAGGPAGESRTDDGFRSGPDDEGFRKLPGGNHACLAGGFILLRFQPVVGDYGAFRGEAFGMLRFLFQIGDRNQEGEIGVRVAGVLEALVQVFLNEFPDGVTPWLDDHAATHCRLFSQISLNNQIIIPLTIVFRPFGQIF